MQLTFAQVATALAQTYGIAEGKRPAFVARLQHLQKLKFPPGTNTGRGRAASYNAGHLFQLGVILELFQFGLPPERSVGILANNAEIVAEAAQMVARDGCVDSDFPRPVVIYLDPMAFSAPMNDFREDETDVSFMRWRLESALSWAGSTLILGAQRAAMFNVTAVFRRAALALFEESSEIEKLYRGLHVWAEATLGPREHVLAWHVSQFGEE